MGAVTTRTPAALNAARVLLAFQAPALLLPALVYAVLDFGFGLWAAADTPNQSHTAIALSVLLSVIAVVLAAAVPFACFYLTFHRRWWSLVFVAAMEGTVGIGGLVWGQLADYGVLTAEGLFALPIAALVIAPPGIRRYYGLGR